MRTALFSLVFIGLIQTPALADHDDEHCTHELEHDQIVEPALMHSKPGTNPVTVYLNRGGTTLESGWDNSAKNTSALIRSYGFESLEIPAYSGSRSKWNKTVECVKNKLSDFDIEVVDERPAGGDYIMAMLGGNPSLFGYPRGVSGVSPFSGDIIPQAVVFVFERSLRSNVEAVCTSAVHEIGHALGLEHQYTCEDPMSYLHGCGEKSFQDLEAWCGEYEPRRCANGGKQNSYRHLAEVVGLRNGAGARVADNEASPASEHDDDPPAQNEPTARTSERPSQRDDKDAPIVSILSPDAEVLGGESRVKILAEVDDDKAEVELLWATPSGNYLWTCSDMPDDVPATCRRKGKYVLFTLDVGVGERAFAMRATSRAGRARWTDLKWLWFD